MPGQFLATKHLKLNNDVYYKTFQQYKELLKTHEVFLDSLLLTTAFRIFPVSTSLPTNSSKTFEYRKILTKISVFQPFKVQLNQPLDTSTYPLQLDPFPSSPAVAATPLLKPITDPLARLMILLIFTIKTFLIMIMI